MDFNATIDLIIKDLNDASGIIDDLKNYPGVPELQVELAKAKCKSAGEVIALLKSFKYQHVDQKCDKVIEPPVKEVLSAEHKLSDADVMFHQPISPEGKKAPGKPLKIKQDEENREKKAEKMNSTEKSDNIRHGSSIIADKFANIPTSINEQIGTRKSEDVTEIIKSKHINSLNAAIGINDRFLFIREIFNGNKDAYEQAISRLELIESEVDAKAVIISYTGSNTETDAVKQLLDLVKRKLSPDE
jgi:hypothetical protein